MKNNNAPVIRPMCESDIDAFVQAFAAQGWDKTRSTFETYLDEQSKNERAVFVAVADGVPAGYVTLLFNVERGPFAGKNIPEIMDFNVLKKYQRQGVGAALMDAVEAYAFERYPAVSLAVGLYADYGTAQRMYVKRGYIPDGTGIWHNGAQVPPYQSCVNDDDLVLYFSKQNTKSRPE